MRTASQLRQEAPHSLKGGIILRYAARSRTDFANGAGVPGLRMKYHLETHEYCDSMLSKDGRG